MTEKATSINTLYEDVIASQASVSRLVLQNFRSYPSLTIETNASPVVLTGANGAGKTNILEAISYLAPGRGMRSAKLSEVDTAGKGPWVVSANMNIDDDEHHIGTGRAEGNSVRGKRVIHLNATQNVPQSELASLCTIMWQTPQMDGLFLAGSSERRRFIDRIVYHFDVLHARRVNVYEHAVRERMQLLQTGADASWLSIVEQRVAAEGVAIAVARNNVVELVASAIEQAPSAFPKAVLEMDCDTERLLKENSSALDAEEYFIKKLFDNRSYDRRSGRTQFGTHRSDLCVLHDEKQMPAKLCSTGEQKALLLSIVLAEARAKALWRGSVPILLLDEVVAHLDETRRTALFEEIAAMKAQCWMTGTDAMLFDSIRSEAQFFTVKDGVVNLVE